MPFTSVRIISATESALAIVLPFTASTLRSGAMEDICLRAKSVNPLNTDSTHTIAIVARVTPATDM